MAMNDDDDDRPRGRRDSKERGERRRRRDEYEDEDDDDRRIRRRQDDGDATGGVIPYKNAKALLAYYCGVFGLISCFVLLGIFGIVPIVLGFLGLKFAREHPGAKGQVHAVIGIALGSVELLTFLAQVVVIVVAIVSRK